MPASQFSVLSTACGPCGERALVSFAAHAQATLTWLSDPIVETNTHTATLSGTPCPAIAPGPEAARDITDWLPDLVLIGWMESVSTHTDPHHLAAADPEGAAPITVAYLHLHGVEAHLLDADDTAWLLPETTLADFVSVALNKLLTDGIAHDITHARGDGDAPPAH